MTPPKFHWLPASSTTSRPGSRQSETLEWRSPSTGAFLIQFDFEIVNGQRSPVGLHIGISGKKSRELTATALRDIPFRALFDAWLDATSKETPHVTDTVTGPQKGSSLSAEVLETVAALYRTALDRGLSPNNFIANEMGISKSTATKRIIRARQIGLLGPTTPGKRGERRTP